MNTNLISVSTKTQTQTKMTTECCPKCGCEMYWRCSTEEEDGCFYDPSAPFKHGDEERHAELDWSIKVALTKKTEVRARLDAVAFNPLPLMLKKNKTIAEKIQLLKILEGNDHTQFAD